VSPDESLANPIQGTEVSGHVWVFVAELSGPSIWEIDDRPVTVLAGMLDVTTLSTGQHRIEAIVQTIIGPVTATATFSVVR
jgi:hypothetical protein